jgi:AcrR family transcriptional regulator
VTTACENARVTDSARKQELLEAAYRYVLGTGLADMSLRPLAKEIGSSPRVLLFLFGSKEGLVRALLNRAREEELRYLAELRDEHNGLAATGRDVWAWLADPAHRALLALWVEGYARSLLGEPGPWADFGRDTVRDWLDLLAERQAADGPGAASASSTSGTSGTPKALGTPSAAGAADPEAERTLLLAVLRGALLDLLATGDTERVTRAVERHLRAVGRPG